MKKNSSSQLRIKSILRRVMSFLLAGVTVLATAWTFGALYYDGPASTPGGWNFLLALGWIASVIVIVRKWSFAYLWQLRLLICCLPVYGYWLTIRPSNDRDWQPEFAETGDVEVNGDSLTFHQFRNFDYEVDGSAKGKITERWESRTHNMNKLTGIDLIFDAFGGKLMAHPMLSFDFGDEGHVLLSIETRKETHESFSTIGGIYKMFELQYVFGDEADFVRVRTNIRKEPCFIYRTSTTAEDAKKLLLTCIRSQNYLKERPRWYNAITTNCTTSYRAQTPVKNRHPFDWRILINGQLDLMLYEKGALTTGGLEFEELRTQAFITDVAQAHPKGKGFSEAIRKGRVGFESKK
ncbi:MAG: hypothetical protein ACI9E1_000189 [Cryomorphaceae bacterium]|jgi:hypothetical protein